MHTSRYANIARQLSRNDSVLSARGTRWNSDGHFLPGTTWEDLCSIEPSICAEQLFELSPESFFVRVRTSAGQRVTWAMLKHADQGLTIDKLLIGKWGNELVEWMVRQLDMNCNTLITECLSRDTILETKWPYERWKSLFGIDAEFIERAGFSQWELVVFGWVQVPEELAQKLKEKHMRGMHGDIDDGGEARDDDPSSPRSTDSGYEPAPTVHAPPDLTRIQL